jgi:hypothetical protein
MKRCDHANSARDRIIKSIRRQRFANSLALPLKPITTRIMFLLMRVGNGRGSELFPACIANGMFLPDMISGLLRQCASHARAVRHRRGTRLSLRVRHPHPNYCILHGTSNHGAGSFALKFMEKLTSARGSQPSDMNNVISLLRDEVL